MLQRLLGPSIAFSVVLMCAALPAVAADRIDDSWTLVVGSDDLERTAAEDLKESIARAHGVTLKGAMTAEQSAGAGGGAVVVGTPRDNPLIAAEHARRAFAVDAAQPEGYHLAFRGGKLFIVGQTPKGAMNGVYRFEQKRTLDVGSLDEHAAPLFRLRAAGHKLNQHPPAEWSDEDQARYYARHYINLVWGEKHGSPMPYEARKKYGLGLMVEVRFPPRGPEWMDDPAHASAVFKDNPNEARRVISPFDPVGRKAYLDAYRELLEKNPDVRVLYGAFADYSVIPHAKSVRASDGAPYGHTRAEGMREVMKIMKEAIGDRRDILPMAWMWHCFIDDPAGEAAFMKELAAAGDGILYNEAGNNDCWLIKLDNYDDLSLRTGPDGKPIFGPNYMPLVSAGGACESVNPLIATPLPRVAAHKIRRLADAKVQAVALWWGSGEGWVYEPNLEVLAEMIWNPSAYDPNAGWSQPLFETIARRDFGPAADRVMEFWQAFDKAVVTNTKLYLPYHSPERPAPDADGLQIFDWYQRMGIFTETVFSQEFAKPLTPAVLTGIKHTKGKETWRTSDFADANYRSVLQKMTAANQILAELLKQDLPGDVKQRVTDSWMWAELYRLLLASQHNYLRAITALHRTQEAGPESEEARQRLTPVVRDEIDNLARMIEHVRRFPPNFNLALPHRDVKDNKGDRDADIAKLLAKRDAMEMWLGRMTNLAAGKPATASSEYNSTDRLARFATDGDNATLWHSKFADGEWINVDLGRPTPVQYVSLAWRNAWAKRYEIQLAASPDGPWRTAFKIDNGAGGVAVHRLPEGTVARYVRMQGIQRGTDWGYALEEFEVFGPASK